jgi:hypothetical protein
LTPRVSFEVRIGKGNLIGLFIADLINYPSGNAPWDVIGFLGLKGRYISAQGNALGMNKQRETSPERA